MLLQEFLAEPDVEQLVVVADGLARGEELAQAAFRHFRGIERLDEGACLDLAASHRLTHRRETDREHLDVLVRHQAAVQDARSRPEVGRRLVLDDAERAALQILDALYRTVVLHHVGGAEPVRARGFLADVGDDLHVDALCAREDDRQPRCRAGIELTCEIRLEALRVGLEEDLLQLILLPLVRREVGARAHQPDLLFGGEAAA